jgi:hypothetical protein
MSSRFVESIWLTLTVENWEMKNGETSSSRRRSGARQKRQKEDL